jgi:PEP-CTERM motif
MNHSSKPFATLLAMAAGLAIFTASSHAQSATATIVQTSPDNFTITLDNTSTDPLNSFWYGWTTSGNNLPSDPSSAGNSLGWDNNLDGNSIQFENTLGGSALAGGQTATFTFVDTSPFSGLMSPNAESVAFTSDSIQFNQGVAGQSTAVFSPTAPVPEPSSFGLLAMGLLVGGFLFRLRTAANVR